MRYSSAIFRSVRQATDLAANASKNDDTLIYKRSTDRGDKNVKQTSRTHVTTISALIASLALAAMVVTEANAGGFTSKNVQLLSQVTLAQLGNPSNGNDCWGYVSASGREYALMGVSDALVLVEITDPSNPDIIGSVSHNDTLWGDVKVYGEYCYVVNESGGGMDIIDLSDADNGVVTLVQRFDPARRRDIAPTVTTVGAMSLRQAASTH